MEMGNGMWNGNGIWKGPTILGIGKDSPESPTFQAVELSGLSHDTKEVMTLTTKAPQEA